VTVSIDLPWPFDPIEIPVTIFNLHDPNILPVAHALRLAPPGPLSFIHRCSGIIGQIDAPDGSTPHNEVLPDVSFDIPFLRLAGATNAAGRSLLNREAGDGNFNEGGIWVTHTLSQLEIWKLDEASNREVLVLGVRAAWLGTADGGTQRKASRLARGIG
jgi:hypothetical protein